MPIISRGLVLSNGSTIALFTSGHSIVLEPDGGSYSFLNRNGSCDTHSTRNLNCDTPFVSRWMLDAEHATPIGSTLPLTRASHRSSCDDWEDYAHWPLPNSAALKEIVDEQETKQSKLQLQPSHSLTSLDQSTLVRVEANGAVSVQSREGRGVLSLCPLRKRVRVTFSCRVPAEHDEMWGYTAWKRKPKAAASPPLSTTTVRGGAGVGDAAGTAQASGGDAIGDAPILVTQMHSLRQVPKCFEAPARVALSVLAAAAEVRAKQQLHGSDIDGGSGGSGGGGGASTPTEPATSSHSKSPRPTPPSFATSKLPSCAEPAAPSWDTLDLKQWDARRSVTSVADSSSRSSSSSSSSIGAGGSGRKLTPGDVAAMAVEASRTERKAELGDSVGGEGAFKAHYSGPGGGGGGGCVFYPLSHCTVREWTSEASYHAMASCAAIADAPSCGSKEVSGRGGGGVGGRRGSAVLVEVSVHCDESVLTLQGEYVTHATKREGGEVEEREFHVSVAPHIRIAVAAPFCSTCGDGGDGSGDQQQQLIPIPKQLSKHLLTPPPPSAAAAAAAADVPFVTTPGSPPLSFRPSSPPPPSFSAVRCHRCGRDGRDGSLGANHSSSSSFSYTLGPFLKRAQLLRDQFSATQVLRQQSVDEEGRRRQNRQLEQGRFNSTATPPLLMQRARGSAHASTLLLSLSRSRGRGSGGGSGSVFVVCEEKVPVGQSSAMEGAANITGGGVAVLTAYSNGFVRGRFTDRTLATLVPSSSAGGSTGRGQFPGNAAITPAATAAYSHCNFVLQDGAECSVPLFNPSSSSPLSASSSFLVAPYLRILLRFATSAFATPQERDALALQRAHAAALVSREMRRTSLFVGMQRHLDAQQKQQQEQQQQQQHSRDEEEEQLTQHQPQQARGRGAAAGLSDVGADGQSSAMAGAAALKAVRRSQEQVRAIRSALAAAAAVAAVAAGDYSQGPSTNSLAEVGTVVPQQQQQRSAATVT